MGRIRGARRTPTRKPPKWLVRLSLSYRLLPPQAKLVLWTLIHGLLQVTDLAPHVHLPPQIAGYL